MIVNPEPELSLKNKQRSKHTVLYVYESLLGLQLVNSQQLHWMMIASVTLVQVEEHIVAAGTLVE